MIPWRCVGEWRWRTVHYVEEGPFLCQVNKRRQHSNRKLDGF
jgi:hypothetical protein